MRILFVIILGFAVHGQDTSGEPAEVTCVIERQTWLIPDYINITWSFPNIDTEKYTGLEPVITWLTQYNTGGCSTRMLTSCICYYGDRNCMYFDSIFTLEVLVLYHNNTVAFNGSWQIDGAECDKPPPVDHMGVTEVRRGCLQIQWAYNSSTCLKFSDKVYKVAYTNGRTLIEASTMVWVSTENNEMTCSGESILCSLDPGTTYTISVQCRNRDFLGRPSGHWSDVTVTLVTTIEDAPTGSPLVTPGGYTIIEDRCAETGTRLVTIYWKEVDPNQRNGRIVAYTVTAGPAVKVVDAESTACRTNMLLTCNESYDVTIRAATAVGTSTFFSKMMVSRYTSSFRETLDVIPEVDASNKSRVWLSWRSKIHINVSAATMFWCLRDSLGQCKSTIDWANATEPFESYEVILTSDEPFSAYKFGVSVDYRPIVWTSCLFIQDAEVTFDPNLRGDTTITDESIRIAWDNPPCEGNRLPGPYIDTFILQVCPLINGAPTDSMCEEDEQQYMVDGHAHSFLLTDLDPSKYYRIRLGVVDLDGNTRFIGASIVKQPFTAESLFERFPLWAIIVMSTVALIVATIGAVFLFRKANTYIQRRCFKEPIILVETTYMDRILHSDRDTAV